MISFRGRNCFICIGLAPANRSALRMQIQKESYPTGKITGGSVQILRTSWRPVRMRSDLLTSKTNPLYYLVFGVFKSHINETSYKLPASWCKKIKEVMGTFNWDTVTGDNRRFRFSNAVVVEAGDDLKHIFHNFFTFFKSYIFLLH
jgi:hypothetical protein